MRKWNFLLLGLGYMAGLLVALKFTKDGKGKWFPEIAEDMKNVHKNLWTEGESRVFSEENKERVAKLKARALREINWFRKDAEETLADLKERGITKKDEIEAAITDLYDRRSEILQKLLDEGIALSKEALEGGEEAGEKLRKKVESLAKDLRNEFEGAYKDIKKKLR